ncbi:MAG TPA: diacylglycerol kinase family protein [Candidatus Limnocylindrales bacterium]|nr:diacylglycerol kinase family protein [Candidatus Limnocylindrales bacterium]
MRRRPILLLVNPVAGGKPGSGPGLADDPALLTADALRDALQRRGLEVSHRELLEGDDLTELASHGADTGHDVVVAGGDGTVSLAAAALVDHPEAALGILAMGSFNNMARGFGVPVTLEQALDAIGGGRVASVDAGWVVRDEGEGRPFFEAAGVGVDAIGFLAVELAERRGWLRAGRLLLRGLRLRKTPMRIRIDETAYRTGSPAVIVSNGPYHGMGFAVAADADPSDGLLTVTVFQGMSRWEVLRHFLTVARRRSRREPRVASYPAKRVTVEGIRRALPAHADGVSIGFTPVTFEIKPRALRIFR